MESIVLVNDTPKFPVHECIPKALVSGEALVIITEELVKIELGLTEDARVVLAVRLQLGAFEADVSG